MEASTILSLLGTLVASFLVYRIHFSSNKRGSSKERRPPGPAALPLIGNILDIRGGELHHALARLAGVHGPVMSLKLGTSNAIVVTSAAGARDALQKHDQVLAGRSVNDAARVLGNHELSMIWLPANSPLFKRLRAVCANHLFSTRGLDATRAVREEKVRELVSCLGHAAGRAVDVGAVVLSGMLNLMSNVLFSEDVNDLSSDHAQELETLINSTVEEITKPNLSDLFPVLAALDLQGRRRNNAEYMKKLYDFFDQVISRRRSATDGAKNGDFLDVLLQLHSEDQFTLQTIKSFILDLFVAGTATTSLTVQWAMAELLRNPAIMSKVHGELQQVLGTKPHPDESDIGKLPYLRTVVMETMRLHPPSPLMMPHVAMADGAEVGGFPMPKGTKVIINVWAIMRDPASWMQPEEFMPERFLGTDLDFRGMDARAFIPFGSGRRVCPGMPMATRSVSLILASLLHGFQWRIPEGMQPCDVDVRDRFGTSLNMVTPLKAIPTPT